MSLKTLKDYAREIENDLRGMDGISQVSLTGFPLEEMKLPFEKLICVPINLLLRKLQKPFNNRIF